MKKPRRLLFFAVACAVMAASGVAASLAASADEIATPSSTIVAEHSDKCLTAANSRLVQRKCSAADAVRQTFRITPADGGYLIGLLAGGCLGLPADARPQVMAACDDADDLTFALLTAGDGDAYSIQGGSGLCLDVAGNSTADGAAVTAAACGESEKWQVTPSAAASPSPSRTRKRTPSASPSATASPTPTATGECHPDPHAQRLAGRRSLRPAGRRHAADPGHRGERGRAGHRLRRRGRHRAAADGDRGHPRRRLLAGLARHRRQGLPGQARLRRQAGRHAHQLRPASTCRTCRPTRPAASCC